MSSGHHSRTVKDKGIQIAKKQRKIDNLVGWMVKAIQEEYSEPVEKRKATSFNNIEGRQYNYNELERALLKH